VLDQLIISTATLICIRLQRNPCSW